MNAIHDPAARRQKIHEATCILERGDALPDDLRRLVAETLRQWLGIEFYGKRNLVGEYERHYKASGIETHQTLRDMAMLKEAANSGPAVLEAAQAALRAKRTNKHVAETLVALLMVAENLKPENASIRAAEILGRDNSASILRQYRRFAANNKR